MSGAVMVAGALAQAVHLLPCTIEHAGPAPVSDYFLPNTTGTTCDGLEVLQAAFRGRELKGAALPLPEGYSGAVLEKREPDTDGVANAASWQATSTFDSFTYWNHDATPLQSDGLRRCLEWAHIAAALHQPTSVAQVEALLADPARDKANKAEHASQ